MEASTQQAPAAESNGQGDGRSKVDHAVVIQLKKDGTKPVEIAQQLGVAVGTVYRILRDAGLTGGATRSVSRGVNVSGELDATIERLQARVTTVDEAVKAENERHKTAVATIKGEADKAKAMLAKLAEVRQSIVDSETE